jgi:predicted Zn-dependent protease
MPQGNRQESRAQLDSALAVAPSDLASAEDLLIKAVTLDPSFANVRFELANILFRQGKVDSASSTLVDGLVIGPDIGRGWLVAAEVFAETNKTEAAVSALKLAIYYANNRDKALEYLKAADQNVASEPLKALIKSALPSLAGVPKSR